MDGPDEPGHDELGTTSKVSAHQLADKVRNADLAFALQSLSRQNRLNFFQSLLDIIIYNHIIILRPVSNFIHRLFHARRNHVVRILGPIGKTTLQFVMAWGEYENTHQVGTHFHFELMRSLPINIKQNILTCREGTCDKVLRRAIAISEYNSVLEESALRKPFLKFFV